MFQTLAGIRRANIPNTNLKWENNEQLNLGIDLSLLRNRVDLSFDYYQVDSKDVVFANPVSSVFGTDAYYDNIAKIRNNGIELSLQASVLRSKDFEWIVGGNIAFAKSEVKSLGGVKEKIVTLEDGCQMITRVGETPYQFYGWKSDGIFQTTGQARTANLTDDWGRAYAAGDMRYADQNGDHIINTEDRVLLGSAQPKYHGAFYTSVQYKNFKLSADFTYAQGTKAYNAVHRTLEGMTGFNNQSESVLQRW